MFFIVYVYIRGTGPVFTAQYRTEMRIGDGRRTWEGGSLSSASSIISIIQSNNLIISKLLRFAKKYTETIFTF